MWLTSRLDSLKRLQQRETLSVYIGSGGVPEIYISIRHRWLILKVRKENQNVLSHFLWLGCVVTQCCCRAILLCFFFPYNNALLSICGSISIKSFSRGGTETAKMQRKRVWKHRRQRNKIPRTVCVQFAWAICASVFHGVYEYLMWTSVTLGICDWSVFSFFHLTSDTSHYK